MQSIGRQLINIKENQQLWWSLSFQRNQKKLPGLLVTKLSKLRKARNELNMLMSRAALSSSIRWFYKCLLQTLTWNQNILKFSTLITTTTYNRLLLFHICCAVLCLFYVLSIQLFNLLSVQKWLLEQINSDWMNKKKKKKITNSKLKWEEKKATKFMFRLLFSIFMVKTEQK